MNYAPNIQEKMQRCGQALTQCPFSRILYKVAPLHWRICNFTLSTRGCQAFYV